MRMRRDRVKRWMVEDVEAIIVGVRSESGERKEGYQCWG